MKTVNKKHGMLAAVLLVDLLIVFYIFNICIVNQQVKTEEYLLKKVDDCVYQADFMYQSDINLVDVQIIDEIDNNMIKGIIVDEHGYYLYEKEIELSQETTMTFGKKIAANRTYSLLINSQNDIDSSGLKVALNYKEYVPLCNLYKVILSCIFIILSVIGTIIFYRGYDKTLYEKYAHFSLKKPTFFEYGILAIIFLIPFLVFMYEDTKAFVHYEVNFWGSIFEGGGLKYFYEYSYSKLRFYIENGIGGQYAADYEFPLYIVLGIWGLPLYIICQVFGLEETTNTWTMIYGKAIFIVALIVTAYMIYKICRNVVIDEIQSKWAAFLFLSSALVTVEVGIVGQLDILGIVFTLLGIYFYQQQKHWKFILSFMIAVSFKQFPLFMFIPLLLLVEKNVVKVGLKTICVWGFSSLSSLLFPGDTMGMSFKEEFADQSLEVLLGVKIPLYNDTVPLVIIILGTICIYCYLKKINDIEELKKYAIYIPTVSIFSLLISFDSNPYWYIQLAPLIAILMIYNSSRIKDLLLFETVGTTCLILNQYGANYWIYDPEWARGTLFDKLFHMPNELFSMKQLSAYLRLDRFSGVFFAVFVLCYITIFVLCIPNKMKNEGNAQIRPYAIGRLLLHGMVSWIPICGVILTCLLYR